MNSVSARIEKDEDVREYRAALANSSDRIRKQFRLALFATAAFIFCVFLSYLFLDVGPFHSHWDPFGKISLALALGSLFGAVYFDGLAWSAWSVSRSMKKEYKEFLEDRFGVTDK